MNNSNNDIITFTLAVTGTQLSVDSNQRNTLLSSLDSDKKSLFYEIEDTLRHTYADITPKLKLLIETAFGATVKSAESQSISESTIFYFEGDDNYA